MASRGRLVVLHFVGQMPLAGIAWQALHYLLGLERLGFEAWYVEDHGANPYDPAAQQRHRWIAPTMSPTSRR